MCFESIFYNKIHNKNVILKKKKCLKCYSKNHFKQFFKFVRNNSGNFVKCLIFVLKKLFQAFKKCF